MLGHSNKGKQFLTSNNDSQILDAGKLVGILSHTKKENLKKVSIVACESNAFGKSVSQMIEGIQDTKVEHLKNVPITTRKHIAIPNPFTGQIYSLAMTDEGLQVFSGGEKHKAKYQIIKDDESKKAYSLKTSSSSEENKKVNKPLTYFFRAKEKLKTKIAQHKQKKTLKPRNYY